jgi:hypothetical protein
MMLLQLATNLYGIMKFRLDVMQILGPFGYQDVSDPSDSFLHTPNTYTNLKFNLLIPTICKEIAQLNVRYTQTND